MRSTRNDERRRRIRQRAARKTLLGIYGQGGLEEKLREFLAQEKLEKKRQFRRSLGLPTHPRPQAPTAKTVIRAAVSMAEKQAAAQRMIENPTPAEAALWELLASRSVGVEFQRQVLILGWIADFYSPEVKVVIEVDGAYHAGRVERDRVRAQVMFKAAGIFTVRFSNQDVLRRPVFVLDRLKRIVVAGQALPRKKAWRNVSKELLATL